MSPECLLLRTYPTQHRRSDTQKIEDFFPKTERKEKQKQKKTLPSACSFALRHLITNQTEGLNRPVHSSFFDFMLTNRVLTFT